MSRYEGSILLYTKRKEAEEKAKEMGKLYGDEMRVRRVVLYAVVDKRSSFS
jgi:hypothetical protein